MVEGIQEKISLYIKENPELRDVEPSRIASIMVAKGRLTVAEAESLPAFGTSGAKDLDKGVVLERGSKKASSTKPDFTVSLTEEQAQEHVVTTIFNDVHDATAILMSIDNGVISEKYDELKTKAYNLKKSGNDAVVRRKIEKISLMAGGVVSKWVATYLYDSFIETADYAYSNVEENIALQSVGANNMYEAKNGELSKKEYYLENVEHLKTMLIRRLYMKNSKSGDSFIDRNCGDMSQEEFGKFLEKYISNLVDKMGDLDTIKTMQRSLTTFSEGQTEQYYQQLLEQAKKQQLKKVDEINIEIKGPFVPQEFNTDEAISFEEVFKYERACKFSKENVEHSIKSETELNYNLGAYNKHQRLMDAIDNYNRDYNRQVVQAQHPEMPIGAPEPNAEIQQQKVIEIVKNYYANPINQNLAKEKLEELINTNNLPIAVNSTDDGNLSLDMSAYTSDYSKNRILKNILSLLSQESTAQLTEVIGENPDNVMEGCTLEYNMCREMAYGNEFSNDLAQAMDTDNKTVIKRVTGDISSKGMALTAIGGVLCFTPAAPLGAGLLTAGNVAAIGGMASESALGYTEALTRDNVSEDEIKEITKTTLMNAGGFAVGMGAGKLGMKAFGEIIDEKLVTIFKKEISDGNRVAALKAVFSDPDNLANFLNATGAKIGTDFLISYAGDLAMMGALDTEDDWQSLLKSNLIGIMVGMSSDIKDVSGVNGQFGSTKKIETPIPKQVTRGGATGLSAPNNASVETVIPRGLTAEDNALIQHAKKENPAEVVAGKVKEQWQKADLHTKVEEEPVDLFNLDPNAGLRQSAPEVNGEVTSLIFTGKLKEQLTQRYDEMGKVFKDIAKDRSADFKKLAKECGNDKQVFANGVVAILAEEMGMKGLEPKIELINPNGRADGFADWTSGTIQISNNIGNAKKIVEIISHEFIHMLQYRDVLAQYGEQGLREIVMNNNKDISVDKKEAEIKAVLESSYTQKLLDNFNELQHSQVGSLNEYITRIYKDELTNPVDPDLDMEAYVNQVAERGAYNLGSEQLGNNTEGLEDVGIDVNGGISKSIKEKALERHRQSQNTKNPDPVKLESKGSVDEFGQIHRPDVPVGVVPKASYSADDVMNLTFNDVCTGSAKDAKVTESGKMIINEQVINVRERALDIEDDIVKFMYDSGFGNPETMTHRAKSKVSLYDKVKNYLFDNENKNPTIKQALSDIRDAVGCRTWLKNQDFTQHPEVKALLEAGDEKGAILRAAELQSQPMVDKIKELITQCARGESDAKITRISNYMGKDGIPYFSERQLEDIQRHAAAEKLYDFSVVTKIDESDANFTPEEIKAHNKKAKTKVRGSGYTALQINFETKNGDVFEWQLRGEKVNVFAEAEHVPYDLRTGKDIIANHPEVAPLYEPIKELLSKDNMSETDFELYNEYLTAHYEHLRKLELGFESVEPELPPQFDIRLKASNLEHLHNFAEDIINKSTSPEEAVSIYNRIVNDNSNVPTKKYNTAEEYNNALRNMTKEQFIEEWIAICKKYEGDISAERIDEIRTSEDSVEVYELYQKHEDLFLEIMEKDDNGEFIWVNEKYETLLNLTSDLDKGDTGSILSQMRQLKLIYKYMDNLEKYADAEAKDFGLTPKQYDFLKQQIEKSDITDEFNYKNVAALINVIDKDSDVDFANILMDKHGKSIYDVRDILSVGIKTDSQQKFYLDLAEKGVKETPYEMKALVRLMEIPEAKTRVEKILQSEETIGQLRIFKCFAYDDSCIETAQKYGLFAQEKLSNEDIKGLIYSSEENLKNMVERKLLSDDDITGKMVVRLARMTNEDYNLWQRITQIEGMSKSDALDVTCNVYSLGKYVNECNLLDYKQFKTKEDFYLLGNYYFGSEMSRLSTRKNDLINLEHLSPSDLIELTSISDDMWPIVVNRGLLNEKHLSVSNIKSLIWFDDGTFNLAKEKGIISRVNDNDINFVSSLVRNDQSLIDAYFELRDNTPEVLKKRGMTDYQSLITFARVPLERREKILQFLAFDSKREPKFDVGQIDRLLVTFEPAIGINPEVYSKMLEFADIPKLNEQGQWQLSASEISILMQHYLSNPEYIDKSIEYLTHEVRNAKGKRLSMKESIELAKLSEEFGIDEQIEKLIYIPERGAEQIDLGLSAIVSIEAFSPGKVELYRDFLFSQIRKDAGLRQFSGEDITQFMQYMQGPERIAKGKELLYIPERGRDQFSAEDIVLLTELSPEQLKIAKEKYFNVPNRNTQFSGYQITEIFSRRLDDAQVERFDKLLANKATASINPHDMIDYATHFQDWQLNQFIDLKSKNDNIAHRFIAEIAQLEGDDYKHAIEMQDLFSNSVRSDFVIRVAKLSDEKYQRAVKFVRENEMDFATAYALARTEDPQILEKYNQAIEIAKAKRNLLKSGLEDLSDENIDKFFKSYANDIVSAIDLLGLPAFTYAYTSKLRGVESLSHHVTHLVDKLSDDQYLTLRTRLADKSIEPQDKLSKVRALHAILTQTDCLPEEVDAYISLIMPNAPVKEDVKLAKDIWSNPKSRFDDKFNLFCETFGIDKDNKKVIDFFNKRAQVNAKGYKILNGVKESEIAKLLEIEVVKERNAKVWNEAIDRKVFEALGIEYTPELSARLNLTDNKYLPEILSANPGFKENFAELVEYVVANPDKSFRDIFNELPQNIETRRQFEAVGIDYDKFVDVDKNSFVRVQVETNAEKQKQAAIENFENDLNDPAFNLLPEKEINKIFKALEEIGIKALTKDEPIYDVDGFSRGYKKMTRLYNGEQPIGFSDMEKVISIVKKTINESEFWTTTHNDSKIDEARTTMYSHIMKLRDTEIKEAGKIKNDEVSNLEVHKTDMNNVSHSLFLGNHANCCTGVASSIGNDYAAPRYIMDKCISAIEIMDGKEFVGNTMCYFAEVDGEISLVLDNIEVSGKYQFNDKIRDAMMEYAAKMCEEVGKPDMPIYAGPYRHKVNMTPYETVYKDVRILGSTEGDYTYIDYKGHYIIDGQDIISNQSLFKIR